MGAGRLKLALINAAAHAAARACERSSLALGLLKTRRFPGKELIVSFIDPAHFPSRIVSPCACGKAVRFSLDLADGMQKAIYFSLYENEVAEILDLIPRGGVCLDVGANVGLYCLHFAKVVGDHGVVHALEPDPDIFSDLTRNCEINALSTVIERHRMAMGDINGSAVFYKGPRSHSGWGSLVEFKEVASGEVSVDVVTCDDFLRTRDIRTVDFIKVDVEANEFEFLEGARQSLKSQVFRYVFIEFNGPRLAQRARSLESFLGIFEGFGYHPVRIQLDLLKKMRDGTLDPERICTNLLFSPG